MERSGFQECGTGKNWEEENYEKRFLGDADMEIVLSAVDPFFSQCIDIGYFFHHGIGLGRR